MARNFTIPLMGIFCFLLMSCGEKADSKNGPEPGETTAIGGTSYRASWDYDKTAASEFFEVLPNFDQLEFNNIGVMFSDEDISKYFIPGDRDWERSDMAETFSYIGVELEDVLQAIAGVEVFSSKPKCNVNIMQFPGEKAEELHKGLEQDNFTITNVQDVNLYTPKKWRDSSLSKMTYAFFADKLIIGDAASVEIIVNAFAGSYEGPTLRDQNNMKTVWDKLPDGFSIHVAIGNEHSYVYGMPVESWGDSTVKIDHESAEEIFIAKFATEAEATSKKDQIVNNINQFAALTGRKLSVAEVTTSKSMVIIYIKAPLKDVVF